MFGLFQSQQSNRATAEELRERLLHPEGAIFIDVRRDDEWNEGHIDGFRHIPIADLESHIDEIKQYPNAYFLCHSGGRSSKACGIMKNSGYNNAINVLGGIMLWRDSGFPIVK